MCHLKIKRFPWKQISLDQFPSLFSTATKRLKEIAAMTKRTKTQNWPYRCQSGVVSSSIKIGPTPEQEIIRGAVHVAFEKTVRD
jgi:hypothetical protein